MSAEKPEGRLQRYHFLTATAFRCTPFRLQCLLTPACFARDSRDSCRAIELNAGGTLNKNSRPILRRATYGSITQGTVFTCARASRYEGCEVFGLAITARCDFAQNKYSILNYLPIVNIHDWLRRDGLDILVETEKNEKMGTLLKILRQSQLSENLILAVPLQEIADTHFPLSASEKSRRALAKQFHDTVDAYQRFLKIPSQRSEELYQWFCNNKKHAIADIVKRLSRHSVLGHYFLENLSHDGSDRDGYVCLLREVNTLPKAFAEKIGIGLDKATFDSIARGAVFGAPLLDISPSDLAMPVVEIDPPTIEHILQVFSSLFGRIGIADPNEQLIDTIIQECLQHS